MTRIKELTIFSAGLLVGWFAWMVAAPQQNCQTVQAVTPIPESIERHTNLVPRPTLEQLTAMQQRVDVVAADDTTLRAELAAVRQTADADHTALAQLQEQYQQATLRAQQQIQQLEEDLAREKRLTVDVIYARDELKQALKQLRTDYIALANKNAALERASIEESAKIHKEGTKVTQRELPPIMQAVVNAGGIPSRVPQVKLP